MLRMFFFLCKICVFNNVTPQQSVLLVQQIYHQSIGRSIAADLEFLISLLCFSTFSVALQSSKLSWDVEISGWRIYVGT
jgi:hypothetical protein